MRLGGASFHSELTTNSSPRNPPPRWISICAVTPIMSFERCAVTPLRLFLTNPLCINLLTLHGIGGRIIRLVPSRFKFLSYRACSAHLQDQQCSLHGYTLMGIVPCLHWTFLDHVLFISPCRLGIAHHLLPTTLPTNHPALLGPPKVQIIQPPPRESFLPGRQIV
jgi:hypothetical protein